MDSRTRADQRVPPPADEAGRKAAARRSVRFLRLSPGAQVFLLGAVATAALSLTGVVLALRLWRIDLSVPLLLKGDTNLALMTVRNMQVSGWFQSSELLNAPLGQDLAGYPAALGDLWNLVGLKVLSLFLTPAQTVNTAFLLTFVLVSVAAFAALRALGVSQRFSIPVAAVYSWLPYHFLRGEGHLFLSNYAVIPLACILAVSIYQPGAVVDLWSRRRWQVAAIGCAVFLGGSGLYYAAFGLVLIAAAGLLASISQRAWRPILRSTVLGAATGLVLFVSALPSLLFRLNGGTFAVEGRGYFAMEYYGLKITNLLLPLGSHRIPEFAALRARTAVSNIPGEGSETLGLLGVVGLVAIVVVLLVPWRGTNGALLRTLRPLGVLAVISILTATVAGLNGMLAVAGFAQLRAWNRMSVVIAFLALAGTAVLLDAAWRAIGRRRHWPRPLRTIASVVTVGAVALVGLADQTSNSFVPDAEGVSAAWESDERFFSQVEETLGSDSQVFQLPFVPFPESPSVVWMVDYDHLRGYLHSDLGWSYGGLKGGAAEWQRSLDGQRMGEELPALVATGFDAIYLNRTGYQDGGRAIEAQISAELGGQVPLVDATGTLAVYDLRGYADELRRTGGVPEAEGILYPVRLDVAGGFYAPESANGETWQWLSSSASATLVNPLDQEKKILLQATVGAETPNATVTIRIGAEEEVITLVDGTADLVIRTTVPPGRTSVVISTDSAPTPSTQGDARDLRLRLVDLTVTELD